MTSTLVSALHVLATASGCTSVAAFADWLLSAPETISNIMKTAGFEADVEAMQASEAAKAASAAAEVEELRAELVAARAAAAAAQDEAIATAAQAAADVEGMRTTLEAAQAEVEAMRAEARKIARTYVKATTADAVVVEAMTMLKARDVAQAQQAAALLQLQARHRAELQSMQLEIHLAEQPTCLPDMVVASTATDLVSMVNASTCHYLVPGVGLLEAGVQTDALAFVCFEEEEEHVEEDEEYSPVFEPYP